MVIDSAPEWIDSAEIYRRRERMNRVVERWFKATLASDTSILDRLYTLFPVNDGLAPDRSRAPPSSSFSGLTENLRLEDKQVFAYPGEERLYVADLWLAHGPQTKFGIRQYWHHAPDDKWRIVGEFSIPPNR